MKIEKIISILRISAKKYQENLENKNFLIIYEGDEQLEYIEVKFSSENFLHLTGVQLEKGKSKKLFYHKCLNGKISKNEIKIKTDGTTKLKLNILEMMTNICKTARMIGKYNNWGDKLYTEYMIGTNYMSIGFIKVKDRFYVPNTALNKNIKEITDKTYRIIAIFSKKISEEEYSKLCYYNKTPINDNEILKKINIDIIHK